MLPEAYGCVVANRFVDLDGDVDPFDLMTEIQMAQEKRKKKKEEVDKKSKKKPGQRETQKDRRFPIASAGGDSVPGQRTHPKLAPSLCTRATSNMVFLSVLAASFWSQCLTISLSWCVFVFLR